jgi:predicted nuclease of predicted toxin-antitoxin system
MKFFADENIARVIVGWLRGLGDDVLYAAEAGPGEPDSTWLGRSQAEERLILNADKDFGELVFRERRTTHGVVLLRMERLTIAQRLARLQAVWGIVEANQTGAFIVITEQKVRVRKLHAM